MAKARGRERRRHARQEVTVGIGFRIDKLPSPGKMISLLDRMRKAKTGNISRTGMCLDTTQLLLPGTRISLTIPKSPITKRGSMKARVVWVRELSAGGFQIGVRYL